MNKRIKQLLSWALVLCLLLSAVPVSGVAAEAENAQAAAPAAVEETPAVTQASGSAPALSEEVTVVREETSLRGEFEKHFLMSDGSYQAVVYSQPVHELVDGVWVEIESTNQNARSDTTTDSTQQNIIDNYVLEGSGVQNSNLNRLYIGNKSGSTARAFIQFAVMPTIPQGAAITAATMTLTIYEGTSTANNASAYMVTGGEWTSGTISWDNMPAANTLLEENISHNNLTKYQFSCLTAVRHWYDGDPTGQNENYGIMVRYYDETIADYNSVFSADYTVATQRPSLTFTYEPPTEETFVSEGGTRRLTPPETTETLIWSSNNSALATVDSTGLVTGIKAGKVTIYALVNGNIRKTYTVYVKVNDGVYRIDSMDNSIYLGTGSGALENAAVSLFAQNTSGLPMLRQLWRITYLGSGYYVIRPLHNMNMALHASAGTVNITTIGDTNALAAVPAENRWTIEFASNGYLLKCRGEDSQSLKCSASYPGASVYTSHCNATNSSFKWAFDTAPTVANDLLLLDTQTGESAAGTTQTILIGQSTTPADLGLAASFACSYITDQDITWSSSAPSVVSIDANTGVMQAHTANGTVVIKAIHYYLGTPYSKTFTVNIAPIPTGTYFIKSSADQRYLQVTNADSSNNYSTSGAIMQQWAYTGEDYQKWIVTLLADGYYSIISAKSGLALSVPSGQIASADVTLKQETYRGYDRQKWKITPATDYQYKIKAKSAEGISTDLAMAVGYSGINASDGVDIQQRAYAEDADLRDEWAICSMVYVGMSTDDFGNGCPHSDLFSYLYATTFYSGLCSSIGGGAFSKVHYYNHGSIQTASKSDFAINGAISSDIDFMIYIGHGHAAHDEQGNHLHYDCGLLETPHVYVSETKEYTYCNPAGNVYTRGMHFGSATSNLRWVWLYTCRFLETNSYVSDDDLRGMMTGAHIVMGYATQSYLCKPNVELFAEYLRTGMPIIEAYFKAGREGEAPYANDNHLQKVLYIPQAENETIYSPNAHYDYNVSDVRIATSYIKDADT